MNLKNFLISTRRAIPAISTLPSAHNIPRVVICIGNEAADADSIVSALSLAYMKSVINNSDALYIPVTNIPRNTLHLRRDVEILLSKSSIALEELICIDDVPLSYYSSATFPNGFGIVILDHNKLSSSLSAALSRGFQDQYVEEIIDHHRDEGAYEYVQGSSRNIAFDEVTSQPLVGSVCTLVTETILKVNDDTARNNVLSSVSVLLKGAILLDTLNMDVVVGKGTERDSRALDTLDSYDDHFLDPIHPPVSDSTPINARNRLFKELVNAKKDIVFWRSLSAKDALLLDYKDFPQKNGTIVGVSSVLLAVEELLSKRDIRSAFSEYLPLGHSDRKLLVVMTVVLDDEQRLRRELCIIARKELEDLLQSLSDFLIPRMQLMKLVTGVDNGETELLEEFSIQCFQQLDTKLSRKQAAIFLQEFYSA